MEISYLFLQYLCTDPLWNKRKNRKSSIGPPSLLFIVKGQLFVFLEHLDSLFLTTDQSPELWFCRVALKIIDDNGNKYFRIALRGETLNYKMVATDDF